MAYSGPSPNQALFPGFSFTTPNIQIPHLFDFQSILPSDFNNANLTQATENNTQGFPTFPTELESQPSNALIDQSEVSGSTQEDESGAYERQQLSSMKEAAIRNLWTSFQRVATNLSSLVAEERKRTHNDLQESLHLWPLFHQTASSLTSFYEEAINIYGRGIEQGIEYGKIVERREIVSKSKKFRKLKKESQQYPERPLSASGDYDEQKCSQPSSPCPNCGYNLQKPSRPQVHGLPAVQMSDQNRKRANSLNYDEMPMEVTISKKPKFV